MPVDQVEETSEGLVEADCPWSNTAATAVSYDAVRRCVVFIHALQLPYAFHKPFIVISNSHMPCSSVQNPSDTL